jgi:hypothetical protein
MITASSMMPLDSSEMFLMTNFPLDSCTDVSKVIDASVPNTLRSAIDCASPGDTVRFNFPVDGKDIVLNSTLTINKGLVIMAEPGQEIIIDGSQLAGDIIHVPSGVEVELIGIKISCGSADCLNVSGELTIRAMTLEKSSP